MAKQFRSRLARKEKERMMKQSFVYLFVTGMLVLVVIFWGIPSLIRVAGFFGEIKSSNSPIHQNDTIPPFPPQLVRSFEATPSASIAVSGYAEADSTIKLINNGEPVDETLTNQEGAFNFDSVNLEIGINEFTAIAVDQAGNKSDTSSSMFITFDNRPPQLRIIEPNDGDEFYGIQEQTLQVKGELDEEAQIYVNDRLTFADSENKFSQQFRMSPGENTITVKVIDSANNQTEETIKVTFAE